MGTIKKSATYEIPFATKRRLTVNLLNIKERQKPKRISTEGSRKLPNGAYSAPSRNIRKRCATNRYCSQSASASRFPPNTPGLFLFGPQCRHWVDFRGLACGDIASHKPYEGKKSDSQTKRERIDGRDSVQKALDQSIREKRATDSYRNTRENDF